MRKFSRFACIDWSGQAVARPKGLALAWCESGDAAPELIGRANGWSRGEVLDWMFEQSRGEADLIVGLDLSPALPFADAGAYFPGVPGPRDAQELWRLVDETCIDEPHLGASSLDRKSVV